MRRATSRSNSLVGRARGPALAVTRAVDQRDTGRARRARSPSRASARSDRPSTGARRARATRAAAARRTAGTKSSAGTSRPLATGDVEANRARSASPFVYHSQARRPHAHSERTVRGRARLLRTRRPQAPVSLPFPRSPRETRIRWRHPPRRSARGCVGHRRCRCGPRARRRRSVRVHPLHRRRPAAEALALRRHDADDHGRSPSTGTTRHEPNGGAARRHVEGRRRARPPATA